MLHLIKVLYSVGILDQGSGLYNYNYNRVAPAWATQHNHPLSSFPSPFPLPLRPSLTTCREALQLSLAAAINLPRFVLLNGATL